MRPFGEAQSKAMRLSTQSGQYHTILESRSSSLTQHSCWHNTEYFIKNKLKRINEYYKIKNEIEEFVKRKKNYFLNKKKSKQEKIYKQNCKQKGQKERA